MHTNKRIPALIDKTNGRKNIKIVNFFPVQPDTKLNVQLSCPQCIHTYIHLLINNSYCNNVSKGNRILGVIYISNECKETIHRINNHGFTSIGKIFLTCVAAIFKH